MHRPPRPVALRPLFACRGACLLGVLLPLAAPGATATSLGSFEGIEEPLVRYSPATGTFRHDDFVNVTDRGQGTFRMLLRYRSDEWDGDRDTPNRDRQRAEVKGLGVHQKTGETFDYATTWRTNPGFQGAGRFCHLFQLKATNGDSGAPLVTVSILPGRERAELRYRPGPGEKEIVARTFTWKPGAWQTIRVRIKTSLSHDGMVLVSVDGDEFQGARDVAVYRPGATDYRPKWGLYRGASPGLALGDDYVEHKDISANRTDVVGETGNTAIDAARSLAQESPPTALARLQQLPPSPARAETLATVAADWAASQPAAAMAWVEKLAPANGRADAMLRVFNRWADQAPDAVLHWAAARAPSSELDPLLWYFATDTTFRYVVREKALAGAELIADPELRARAIDHVALIWARREPQAAAHYVEASASLDPAQKATLLAKIYAKDKKPAS